MSTETSKVGIKQMYSPQKEASSLADIKILQKIFTFNELI
jgi:hypothetical protein